MSNLSLFKLNNWFHHWGKIWFLAQMKPNGSQSINDKLEKIVFILFVWDRNYDVVQVGVVKAFMAFSIKFNLAMISIFVAVAALSAPVKSLIVVRVNAVFPTAWTYKNHNERPWKLLKTWRNKWILHLILSSKR